MNVRRGLWLTPLLTAVLLSPSSGSAQPAVHGVEADSDRGWALLQALEFVTGQRLPFEEITESRLLKAPSVARGVLWMNDLGVLTMQLQEPAFERRTLAQDTLTLTRLRRSARRDWNRTAEGAAATAAADHHREPAPEQLSERSVRIDGTRPAQVLLRAIATLLRGDLVPLKSAFTITSVQPGSAWEVALRPQAEALARRLPAVRLVGRGNRLLSIDADRGAQGQQTVRLLVKDTGPSISPPAESPTP